MTNASYQQFCPVAMAAEVLCTRWTVVLLRELVAGSTRFNELRRGVPRMSPALLSKRLRELEAAGVVERERLADRPEVAAYRLTPAGRDLQPVIEAIGIWGQKWVETEPSLENLDPELLMWDMRRNLDTRPVPSRRVVIEFIYPELPRSQRKWWLIVEPDRTVDLCHVDPGFDVDLYATVDLRTMTEIWMGLRSVADAVDRDALLLVGSRELTRSMQTWLGLSPFARQEKLAS
ncbi:winged helix-turn-helix transcriptional regulator [Histidinibacterium aquaticum]|uniref:Helix-turn-helix transcriptional regulator n=1 Tax=Histidinibacterium aquaticum TaxID=2613962 RepID=A0A5J5GCE4_9RHOB|nr:helix-turn-helix domain-containing protein [Histidinibacterium aquaticum]KAA9005667.1 helix-turn-helix transcriptional regulator [Histidinibacterium aquaticum]